MRSGVDKSYIKKVVHVIIYNEYTSNHLSI